MSDCLILNADHNPMELLPLSTVPWTDAIRLLVLDKIVVLESYDNWVIHSAHSSIAVPSVGVMREYFNYKKAIRFSRANLYLRDMYHCQFCGEVFDADELTIDHVFPRALGGKTSWTNCVTACQDCNHRKGNKILKPLNEPYKPDYYNLVGKWRQRPVKVKDPRWYKYLGIKI